MKLTQKQLRDLVRETILESGDLRYRNLYLKNFDGGGEHTVIQFVPTRDGGFVQARFGNSFTLSLSKDDWTKFINAANDILNQS